MYKVVWDKSDKRYSGPVYTETTKYFWENEVRPKKTERYPDIHVHAFEDSIFQDVSSSNIDPVKISGGFFIETKKLFQSLCGNGKDLDSPKQHWKKNKVIGLILISRLIKFL